MILKSCKEVVDGNGNSDVFFWLVVLPSSPFFVLVWFRKKTFLLNGGCCFCFLFSVLFSFFFSSLFFEMKKILSTFRCLFRPFFHLRKNKEEEEEEIRIPKGLYFLICFPPFIFLLVLIGLI